MTIELIHYPRRWSRTTSAIFSAPDREYGALSNFARRYPVRAVGVEFATSEALYQALRFPDQPDIQQSILAAPTPKAAKLLSHSSPRTFEWESLKDAAMWVALSLKHRQHRGAVASVLESTRGFDIVELSKRDVYWGAVNTEFGRNLHGGNVLGQMWMHLRTGPDVGSPDGVERLRLFGSHNLLND